MPRLFLEPRDPPRPEERGSSSAGPSKEEPSEPPVHAHPSNPLALNCVDRDRFGVVDGGSQLTVAGDARTDILMRSILCATDLSQESDIALREAAAQAQQDGAALTVTFVLPLPAALATGSLGPVPTAYTNLPDLQSRAIAAVGERAREVTGLKPERFQVRIEHGRPGVRIVQLAEEMGVDLIVLGARGGTGLARLLLGSVAEEVVRHAHCPVLVTRWPASSGPVVAATDFSDPALPAITAAASAASRMGAPLAVVHAIEPVSPLSITPHLLSEAALRAPAMLTEGARQAAAADLDRALDSAGVEGEKVVLEGSPAAAIVRFLEERNARLIVVGTTGRTGLRRMLLGSVAEAIVRTAPCTVLVVRLARKD